MSKESTDGIHCARCGCGHFRVLYTRKLPFERIKRVRQCRHCGARHLTFEKVHEVADPDGMPTMPGINQGDGE